MVPLTIEESDLWKIFGMCYFFNETFNHKDRNFSKGKYHCHFTRKYRGAVYVIQGVQCNEKPSNLI